MGRLKLLTLAGRNLLRHPRRVALAITALTLGIAAVVTLRGVVGGIQQLNVSIFVDGSIGALQVHRTGYTDAAQMMPLQLDFEDTPQLREKLLAVQGVKAIAPRIYFGAALAPPGDQEAAYFMAIAVDPLLEAQVAPRRVRWASQWLEGTAPQLLLDSTFGEALGLPMPSPELTDAQPALLASDRDEALNGEVVKIIGSVGQGFPGDVRQGLVTLGLAQRLLRSEGRVAEYAIAVHRLDGLAEVKRGLEAALGPSFEVHTFRERVPVLRDVEKAQDVFGLLMSGIVLAVVLLGVGNLQLMSVMDRVREVGTLLAIGMRRRRVVALFVLEGLLLGLIGSALGLLIGEGVLAAIDWHGLKLAAPGAALEQDIHPALDSLWRWGITVAGVLGATISSGIAARRLSKLSAAEALAAP
ncbi:MAG: hypothetical protein H6Q89_2274 [Myxococcaceae bacterium]|nr:hypothetical protein [Myxococcaceae bacterium]